MLTAFSLSCKTTSNPVVEESETTIDLPTAPQVLPVKFEESQDKQGLFISYDEYRNLANNIIEYRRYIEELEEQIIFYKSRR